MTNEEKMKKNLTAIKNMTKVVQEALADGDHKFAALYARNIASAANGLARLCKDQAHPPQEPERRSICGMPEGGGYGCEL